jgi:NAD(P)-dependent dehydrogenase (short-subunit alcohol dehydrogenase family)
MSGRFGGRVVVVTGAVTGLGRSIASAFVDAGAKVAVLDLDDGRTAEVAATLRADASGEAIGVGCDVTRRDSVAAAFAAVAAHLGPVDVLVNNAGVSSTAPFLELDDDAWDRVMDTNAKGAFLCAQAAAAAMGDRGGAIVNVSSQAAKNGEALIAHYCASKAAVLGLTRALALELAPAIRVNAVCPGVIDTDMVRGTVRRRAAVTGRSEEELLAEVRAQIPLGRLQSPESIAEAILYLAAAEDVTGLSLDVSGGMVMG